MKKIILITLLSLTLMGCEEDNLGFLRHVSSLNVERIKTCADTGGEVFITLGIDSSVLSKHTRYVKHVYCEHGNKIKE